MFWADQILQNMQSIPADRPEKEWINDAWTPSGIVHMGGLKGPVIHDTLYRILKEQGKEVKYTFGFDDMDAIDGLPENLQEKLGEYMGIPVCNAPSPDGNGSFGDYYAGMMREMFKKLDIQAEIYLASDYYKKGIYNRAIQFVLDHADKVRQVYEEMYKKKVADTWFPLQVVCPSCGKVGTTEVTAWDGKEVSYTCRPDKVKWAKGCEKRGTISPFDGNSTMPFKVEWAAKWWTFGVTIEGAGKDHASSGGTYDIARKLVKDVFGQEPPLWLPYEFFLYDGKKMSSSKGLGLTGQQLLEVIPPQMVRFLMTRTEPNQAVEFNPNGTLIIPKLFEEYDKAAEATEDYLKRPYDLSAVYKDKSALTTRFLTLAQWVQMPNMDDEIKKENLEEWAKYAKIWVEKYAPESEKFAVKKDIPEETKNLTSIQREYLKKLSEKVNTKDAEALQLDVYNLAKDLGLSSKDAFQAIYLSLLGKDHGPKAAWLVLSLDKKFVQERFREIGK
ncbi:MAG: lysine--tRNA ligase [Candidatus Levybacteria bacterium]|nr:lysine--tRNA ligase [Candidatus Levybacteria bacterium]